MKREEMYEVLKPVNQDQQDDAMNYAQVLQKTIFPDKDKITRVFPESFIFHESKAILSGDFFWFDKKDNRKLFSVADCTGHGVAGALLSFMGITMLDHLIVEDNIINPSEVLEKLNTTLYQALSKKFGRKTIFDGLEIGLVSYNEEKRVIEYSGAGCPLYHLSGEKLYVYEGQYTPIGHSLNPGYYKTETINVEKGDQLFLFTDGYADQFGAATGKKFKYHKLRNLLVEISDHSIEEQKCIVRNTFYSWRGTEEQTDDVTVIGVRL